MGEYAVTVSATTAGNYSGTVTRKFSIVTKGTATFDIALGTTSVVYDGKAKTPGVTVTDGGVLLTENDYAVFYLKVGTDAWEFVQELLSRGDRIEVLKPQSLRKEITHYIEMMRGRYAE